MNIKETKKNIILAGHIAVEELIKVAKEAIVDSDEDIISSSESTIASLATLIMMARAT